MAVQEAVEGFPVTLNAGAPLGRANEKMAAPIAARKAVGASPTAATAVGPPAKKNYETGKPPHGRPDAALAAWHWIATYSYVRRWLSPWPSRRQIECGPRQYDEKISPPVASQ